nr:D-Ala-D-Ala carboxypeptidase family metallohydrolase [Pseudoponticoccus marisrubri]
MNEPALDKLQALRDRLDKPLIVRSAYRSHEHNRAVGGATRSKHLDGAAFDIAMANHDPASFEAAARFRRPSAPRHEDHLLRRRGRPGASRLQGVKSQSSNRATFSG